MGMDIMIYAEVRKNGKWEFSMPTSNLREHNYYESFDVGGRVPALFQILSRVYNDNYGKDFKSISNTRGLPNDMDSETVFYLEDLSHCSYVSLSEILKFNWDIDSEKYDKYKDIVPDEFFNNVVVYLQTVVSELVTEDDIRIIFGYSM
jgi:hypothetical protein